MAHLRLWLDQAFSPSEVRYPFPEPLESAALEAFFGVEVRLGADRCAIRFDASLLDRPQQLADPQLAAFLERYAEDALATLPEIGRVSTRVRELLARGLKDGELSLKSVAKALGMSERSLQRQLNTENTTLKRVTEELRRDLATTYLKRHDLSVSDVAYMLGFSETAPFFRAFKKWTGLTPGDFRRGLRTHFDLDDKGESASAD